MVQNDRQITDRFTLRGTHAGSAGYHIRYRRGATDITEAVQAGTYRTGPLEPGEAVTIKIKITALNADLGSGHTVDILATSRTNAVARDTVRA